MMDKDPVSIGLKRINALRKWRGASYSAALRVPESQVDRLRELAAELHALYADVSGQQHLSAATDRKITGTICELLRLHEQTTFQDATKSGERRTA